MTITFINDDDIVELVKLAEFDIIKNVFIYN